MLRRLWGCYTGCAVTVFTIQLLTLLGLIVVLAGMGLVKVPGLSDIAFRPPPAPPTAQPDPQVAQRLQQRLDSALRRGGPFTLEITEGELNSLLSSLGGKDAPVKDPLVRLLAGKGELYGVLMPIDTPFQATFTIVVEGGQPRLKIQSLSLRVMPLPGPFADLISSFANDQLGSIMRQMPLTIQKVELLPGKLVLSGTPR